MRIKTGAIARILLGSVIFVGLNAGVTFELQRSLVVFRQLGSYAHWAVILLGLPLVSGLVMRAIRLPYVIYVILISSIISAAVLYLAYRNRFWAEPPHPLLFILYVGIVVGISVISNLKVLSVFRIAARLQKDPSSVPVDSEQSEEKVAPLPPEKSKELSFSELSLPGFLESPRYAGLLATVQLALAFLSLVLSVIGILVLGSK